MPQLRGNIAPGRFMKIVFPFHRGSWLVTEADCGHGQPKADFMERELCTHGLSVQARLAVSRH